jgi:hypothetical protein
MHVKEKIAIGGIKKRAEKPRPKTRLAPDLTPDSAFCTRN